MPTMSFLVALLILLALLLMLFLVMGPALAQAAAMSVPSTMILKTTPRTQPTQPATIIPPSQPEQPEVFEDEFIDLERIGGRVKASSVKTVEGLVQTHQQEALAVIRGWMAQNGY